MSTEPNAPSDLLALIQRFNSAIEAVARRSDEIGEEEWYERAALESMHSISGADADLIALCSPANLHVLTHYAARPSLSAQAVGDGWVLVPREPTEEMWSAFRANDYQDSQFHPAYRAMIAAAPTPPQPADGGDRVELIELLLTLRDKFQDINLDDDGDNYMNDSCDGMDLIDAALAKFQPAGGENDGR